MPLNIPALIQRKRDGLVLSGEEINFFIKSVVDGSMKESQIGAMLMAIYLKGLNSMETVELTRSMTLSGEVFSFPQDWESLLVDKHSTGGVGDKISLVLAPALAALGFKVPMVSGRGLGFTGGTLDKLESILGFESKLNHSRMVSCLDSAGCFIAGATGSLAPADAILYQMRDVTSTVDCIPLIVSSILSKKVAEGTKALVMDVKVGRGTFLKSEESAREISKMLVEISKGLGVDTKVVLSRMDSPVGCAIGNALEVVEAVDCLKGKGPQDIKDLVNLLGGTLLVTKGRAKDLSEGAAAVAEVTENGLALNHFFKMLMGQGVQEDIARELCYGDPSKALPTTAFTTTLGCATAGYVADIDALALGLVCWELGAGRHKASDDVDHAVGLLLLIKPGECVTQGDPWIRVFHSTPELPHHLKKQLEDGLIISEQSPSLLPTIIGVV